MTEGKPQATESSEQAVTDPTPVVTLRIHGVGGSPGPRLVSCDHPREIRVVGEGAGDTVFIARRDDDTCEGYDWGALTSGGIRKALWVVLLPFTVMNVAGWMHPDEDRFPAGQIRLIRAIVHLLSLLLTGLYVACLGSILVDALGFQFATRVQLPDVPVVGADGTVSLSRPALGLAIGLLTLAGAVAIVGWMSWQSQQEFEGVGDEPPGETASGPWQIESLRPQEDLSAMGFFAHKAAAARLLLIHGAFIASMVLVVAVFSLQRLTDQRVVEAGIAGRPASMPSLHLSRDLVQPLSALTFVVVAVLWLVSAVGFKGGRVRFDWPRVAAAATVPFCILNSVYSGTMLLIQKRLNELPKKPDHYTLDLSADFGLVDIWTGVLVALLVLGLVAFAVRRRFGTAVTDPERKSAAGAAPDGLARGMSGTVRKARGAATLMRNAHKGAVVLSALFFGAGTVAVIVRRDGWTSLEPRGVGRGPLWEIGAYLLPAVPVAVGTLISKGLGGRTAITQAWDVLTFWPRRFSPLAVRPSSEKAVPEIRGRLRFHRCSGRAVVVCAHSQGSVLAFSALAPLEPEELRGVALVTYGSPLATVYRGFFPAYFADADIRALSRKLSNDDGPGWSNWYRETDPIGGSLLGPPGDACLPDPATDPPSPGLDPPWEPDRDPYRSTAHHSHYLAEPRLKRAINEQCRRLARIPQADLRESGTDTRTSDAGPLVGVASAENIRTPKGETE